MFVGGVLGVFARELLTAALPDAASLPVAVLVANMVGALLLGYLLESLVAGEHRGGARAARGQRLRLLLGTGVLGGFTTYSAVALGVTLLAEGDVIVAAVLYGFATIVCGTICTWLGVVIAGRTFLRPARGASRG